MIEYTKDKPLRVFEAFGGYGSQSLALKRLKQNFPEFDYKCVGYSDIDKAAIKAYFALHEGEDVVNYGDICTIDWNTVPDFDLFTYSFPCTDISNAGKQMGLGRDSGTRSSLLWECERAVEIKRPKYLLMENVKALLQKKFLKDFHAWLNILEGFGYYNAFQVLNAADYGVPQHRERVFCVSILRTADNPDPTFSFPQPFPLERKLKDVLEEHVDEKYYLSDKMLEYFQRVNDDDSHGHDFKPKDGEDTAFTVRTAPGQRVDDNFVKDD